MNERAMIRPISVALIALVVVGATIFLAIEWDAGSSLQIFPGAQAGTKRTGVIDDEAIASTEDLSAFRWQAMARYYEAQGLLTRDESAVNDAAFLARNPELSAAAYFAPTQNSAVNDAAFLARNPELSAAARYAAAHNAN